MTDRILIVTPPDDILLGGIRILHVELNEQQSSTVSSALLDVDSKHTIINYVWKMGNPISWLLDKSPKSDVIFFNADGPSDPGLDVVIGWIAAQPQSYYFGNLKDLQQANDRAIYSVEDVKILLERISKKYDQR